MALALVVSVLVEELFELLPEDEEEAVELALVLLLLLLLAVGGVEVAAGTTLTVSIDSSAEEECISCACASGETKAPPPDEVSNFNTRPLRRDEGALLISGVSLLAPISSDSFKFITRSGVCWNGFRCSGCSSSAASPSLVGVP